MAAANTIGLEASHSPTLSQQPSLWWNPHPLCCSSLAPFLLSLAVFAPAFFFLHCISVSFSHFPFHSLSVSPFLSLSLSSCLCGPPLGWLLLAAPVPPTLSLDMLFIGLQRGWLSVQGGCCLKQCSLNKRGRSSQRALCLMCSLSVSVDRHQVHHAPVLSPFIPFPLSPIQVTWNNYPKSKKRCFF